MLFVCVSQGAQLKLQNRFSIGLQTIPISSQSYADKVENFHAKMLEIKKHSDLLRNSPDYYVNKFVFHAIILYICICTVAYK